jgi:hypothetical protein
MKSPILRQKNQSSRTTSLLMIFVLGMLNLLGCEGPEGVEGKPGVSCWDLNGNGIPDVATEDINHDGVVDVKDCAGIGDEGPNGEPGISSGTIVVTLTDQAGAVVVGASVVTDPASRTVSTNTDGVATLDNVPVGVYTVFGQKNGFKVFEAPDVSITAGSTVTLAGVLAPGRPWSLIDVVGISGPEGDKDTSADTRVTLAGSVLDKSIVTNGLRNVGVGTYVYLTGAEKNKNDTTITAWSWEIASAVASISPAVAFESTNSGDSTAARTWSNSASTRWVRFRPMRPGIYTVTLTVVSSDEQVSSSSVDISVGSFVGEQACVGCHSQPDIVGANKAVYEDYLQTGHASKLVTTYDNPGYRDLCLPCHVTGYDESATNGGFDDRLRNAGWTDGSAVDYLKDLYPTIADLLADPATLDVQTVMNVQCEACHGPGANHPEAEAHLSFGAGTCKQCHHQPVQWALSAHSLKPQAEVASGPDCLRCHTGQGFVVVQDHGEKPVFPDDAGVTRKANMFEPGNAQPIGCAACHDPHKFTNPYDSSTGDLKSDQLRFEGTLTAPMGFQVAANKAAVCVKCHANRRDSQYLADYLAGKKGRGPHLNTQADVLVGKGGAEYAGKSYSGTAFHYVMTEERCITCHMNSWTSGSCITNTDCPPYAICYHGACQNEKFGAHTFNMTWTSSADTPVEYENVASCNTSSCHLGLTTFNRVPPTVSGDGGWDCDETTTGIQSEIEQLLTDLQACLIKNPLLAVDGALADSGYDRAGISAIERQAAWNYWLIKYDGSMGVHNAHYAARLLRDSYDDLGCTPALSCPRP